MPEMNGYEFKEIKSDPKTRIFQLSLVTLLFDPGDVSIWSGMEQIIYYQTL